MKMNKKVVSLGLATLMVAGTGSLAMADLVTIVGQDANQVNYEFGLTDLDASYAEYQLGGAQNDTLLYRSFMDLTAKAFYDDTRNAYVDVQDINDAYGEAQIAGASFDANAYAEADAKLATEGTTNIQTAKVENGEFVTTPKDAAAVTISTVTAVDGSITVALSGTPATEPTAASFTITASVANGTNTPVQSTVAATVVVKTANGYVLTVPAVAAAAYDQTVTYTVKYGDSTKSAAAFTVAKVEALAVNSVSAITTTGFIMGFASNADLTSANLSTSVTLTPATGTPVTGTITYNNTTKTATVAATLVAGTTYTATATGLNFGTNTIAVPAELAVDSITATSLKQIKVVFNGKIDKTSAETESNYELNNTKLDSTNYLAKLQEDGKTVIITLGIVANDDKMLTNNTDYVFKVNSIKSEDLKTSTSKIETIKNADTTVPSMVSATVTGSKTIDIFFNEPVAEKTIAAVEVYTLSSPSVFLVDGGSVNVTSAVADPSNSKITLTLSADLVAGNHTVKLTPIATIPVDYAGYSPLIQTINFESVADATAPTASIVSASEKTVKLRFSKPVTFTQPADDAVLNFYHSYNLQNGVTGIAFAPDTTTGTGGYYTDWTVTYTNTMSPGNVDIYLDYVAATVNTKKIRDSYGNVVAPVKLVANVTEDKTAPTVDKVYYEDSTHLQVTFSESVSGATIPSNYTLKNSAGDTIAVNSVAITTGNTYRLTTAELVGGNYTLTIGGVKDTSIATNQMVSVVKTFTAPDATSPTVKSVLLLDSGKKVRITFSEDMSDAGLTEIGNYTLSINAVTSALPDGAKVTKINSKTVDLDFISAPANLDGTTDNVLIAGSLKDLAGNPLSKTVSVTASIVAGNSVTFALVADSIKAIDKNHIEFIVDKQLSGYDLTGNKIQVNPTGGGLEDAAAVAIVNDTVKNQSKVTLTTTTAMNADLASFAGIVVNAGGLTTIDGNAGSTLAATATDNEAKDYAVSSLTKSETGDADADGQIDRIVITYDEALQQSSVSKEDYTVEGYTIQDYSVSGAVVTLTIAESGVADTGATPKVTQVGSVNDNSAQHNLLGAQTGAVAIDKAAPVLTFNYSSWATANAGAASAKTFVLQSSEKLATNAGAGATAIGATAPIATSTPVAWTQAATTFALSAITANDTTVTLTTDGAANNTSATGYTTLTLGTTDGQDRIVDLNGNKAVANVIIK